MKKFLSPDIYVNELTQVTPKILNELKIKTIILDVDNTLVRPDTAEFFEGTKEWIEEIKKQNFNLIIASNNYKKRVFAVANALKISIIPFALKPFSFKINMALQKHNCPSKSCVFVGDQIFTDVLTAKFIGAKSILLDPQFLNEKPTVRLKRFLERPIKRSLSKLKTD